jgi:hypothetical protein
MARDRGGDGGCVTGHAGDQDAPIDVVAIPFGHPAVSECRVISRCIPPKPCERGRTRITDDVWQRLAEGAKEGLREEVTVRIVENHGVVSFRV